MNNQPQNDVSNNPAQRFNLQAIYPKPTEGPLAQRTGSNTESVFSLPKYRDIMHQVRSELDRRKGLLFGRVLLLAAPYLLLPTLFYIIVSTVYKLHDSALSPSQESLLAIAFIGMALVLLWNFIIGRIFKIERILWVDSYFDEIPLSSSESWKLAASLFWPSLLLDFSIFFRYYAIPLLIAIAVAIGVTVVFQQSYIVYICAIILTCIGFGVYTFMIGLRLRYIWFVFIDMYGTPGYSIDAIYKQMYILSEQLQQEDFKRLIASTLTIDVTAEGADLGLNATINLIGMMGGPFRDAARMVQYVGSLMIRASQHYAKMVSYYMFYRLARQSLYGVDNNGSTSLYKNTTTFALTQSVRDIEKSKGSHMSFDEVTRAAK